MVVKQSTMPLSTEELIETLKNNPSTILFPNRDYVGEKILRNSSDGQLIFFEMMINKYPPAYLDDFHCTKFVGRTKRAW
jgi:hypothetical protein